MFFDPHRSRAAAVTISLLVRLMAVQSWYASLPIIMCLIRLTHTITTKYDCIAHKHLLSVLKPGLTTPRVKCIIPCGIISPPSPTLFKSPNFPFYKWYLGCPVSSGSDGQFSDLIGQSRWTSGGSDTVWWQTKGLIVVGSCWVDQCMLVDLGGICDPILWGSLPY